MRMNRYFESALERRVRVMSRNFGIRVVIQGSGAYTDGKTIYLPMLEDTSEEVMADLDGFADHEVAHCMFSDFEAMKNLTNRWHKELFNAVEDSRIELLLPLRYPGTRTSLARLNQKWGAKMNETRWKRTDIGGWVMPWPIRLILCIREVYDCKVPQMDEMIEPIMMKIMKDCAALRLCRNSGELLAACEELRKKINQIREDMFDGSYDIDDDELAEGLAEMMGEPSVALDPKRKEREAKQAKGREVIDPAVEQSKSKDAEQGEGDSEGEEGDSDGETGGEDVAEGTEEDSGSKGDGAGEGAEGENASISAEQDGAENGAGGADGSSSGKQKQGQGDASDNAPTELTDGQLAARGQVSNSFEGQETTTKREEGETKAPPTVKDLKKAAEAWKEAETKEEQEMLEAGVDEKSEFDKHVFSSESYMGIVLEEAIERDVQRAKYKHAYDDNPDKIDRRMVSLPYSREFDEVIDYTGKGDRSEYAARKLKIMPQINPIKLQLERVLKVKENARFRFERERGALNTRDLMKLSTDPNYRKPFKDFVKEDTKDVAITMLWDCSGSMSGDKMELTRQAGLAMGESLKALNMPFECLGFNTSGSAELQKSVRDSGLSAKELERFQRKSTILRLMVFKSFGSNDLSGICHAKSGGANADGESLIWAAKRLALRKEKRKILIVLSDGQPANEGDGWVLAGDLKRVVSLLPKAGIEPIGIGILCDSPKNFYPNWVMVDDINSLPTTAMKQLSKILKDGVK